MNGRPAGSIVFLLLDQFTLMLCSFVSTPHFSKCYREYFGVPPSDERSVMDSARSIVPKPLIRPSPAPVPMNVMEQARGEATFANVKNPKP
jgi:hypothetical protein